MDYPSIPDYYQPELSDPVKALIQYGHPEYLETHKGEYLKLWVQLGLKYPLDYWNAFVDQTKGYWFPGAPGMLTNEGISPNELGLSWQPVLHGQGVPLRYNNDKQKKPLFSRGLSVCRLLFNSFSKLKIDENYKEKRRLFY